MHVVQAVLVALSTLFLAACSSGGDPPAFPEAIVSSLDAAIAERMSADALPGAVVAVQVPGEGEYVVARGTANLATGTPRRVEDPFRIASITKTFIGTLILQLADEGRLSTADRLSRWYPDFPNADAITVDDLLRMKSGIPDSADGAFLAEYFENPLLALSPEDMIARAAARADQFVDPGRAVVYTNVNFMLLEQIAVKQSGQDIDTLLRQRIFDPLGLSGSFYPGDSALPGALRGYSQNPSTGAFQDMTTLNPIPAGGAGAIVSTTYDLMTYARAVCTGRLLTPDTQATRMRAEHLENAPDFVGYGQAIVKFGKFCGHNGTIFGFSSEMWYLPEKDAVIVIDVNRLDEDDESKSTDLFIVLTRILFPELVEW
jgi:D-alanyl-D-alanine carboxypeptidase